MNRYLWEALTLLVLQIITFPLVRIYHLYSRLWYIDKLLHIEGGVMFGLFWFWLIRGEVLSKKFKYLSGVMAAVFGSVLWEFWEFGGHVIVPHFTVNYIPTLSDTLGDIAAGALGAIIFLLMRL